MIHFFTVMAALTVPVLIGWMALWPFFRRTKSLFFLEKISIATGLGLGIVTIAMFHLSVLGSKLSTTVVTLTVLIPVLIFSVCAKLWFAGKDNSKKDYASVSANSGYPVLNVALLAAIFCAAALLFFRSFIVAYDLWDSWAFWAFKAKIYFIEQRIPFEKFREFSRVWGNWDYPHHLPLMETWVFLWLKEWNDQWSRIVPVLFHVGLCVLAYAFFRKNLNRTISLLGTFFILTLPGLTLMSVGAIGEPILLYYYVASFLFLLEWERSHYRTFFILSAIFSGLAAWTKNEGVVYCLFNILIILFMTRRMSFVRRCSSILSYVLIAGVIIGPWWVVKMSLGLKNSFINTGYLLHHCCTTGAVHAFRQGLDGLFDAAVRFNFFNITWVMFFVLFLLNWRACLKRPFCYFILSIIFQIVVALIFSAIVPIDQYLSDTFYRLLLAPAIFMIMYVILLQQSLSPSE